MTRPGVVLAALFLMAPGALDAQDPAEQGAAQYEVELVVFRNLASADASAETPPADGAGVPAAPQAPAAGMAWPELAPASLRLTGIAARLRKPGTYELLYHGGWVQAIDRQNRAGPAALPPAAASAGLTGALTLYRERYLHVLVDVALAGARIHQGRRLRGQAVQYFDDPRFGILLAVRPAGDDGRARQPASS